MKKNKKGSILAYALGVIAFVSILLLGLVQLITSQARFGYDTVNREKAFEIVESCAHEYRWYLAHNTDGHTIDEVEEFWNKTGADSPRGLRDNDYYPWDIKDPGGANLGHCKAHIVTPNVNVNTPIVVEFEGYSYDNPNIKKKLSLRFRRTSWSDYVVLSNEFASFDSSWVISGKVMSNTGVHFEGVANGKVYAGSATYFDPTIGPSGENKPGVWTSHPVNPNPPPVCEFNTAKGKCVFGGGKRYPVPKKDFAGIAVNLGVMRSYAKYPSDTTIDKCQYGATRNNCYFSATGKEGVHLTFKDNGYGEGTFEIVTVKDVKSNSNDIKNEISTTKKEYDIPENGIIFVDDTMWVDGKINGNRVTVVAAGAVGNIYIGNGNLKYVNRDNNETLGLIAQKDILLTSEKNICDGSCSDLEIDAAMVAKDGMIGKKNFNPNCCGVGCESQKNRIDVYGSVVSNKFLEFAASKECSGHSIAKMGFQIKNIEYDNNLFLNPPPFFPSDVYYTVDSWEEIKGY